MVYTYTCTLISVTNNQVYTVYMSTFMFFLQGFWNFIAFIRPRFVLERQKYQDARFLWIMKVTIFGISPAEERKMRTRNIEMKETRIGYEELPV